ncbi:MAG: LemA family protein [Bdellovibrionales bacterium]
MRNTFVLFCLITMTAGCGIQSIPTAKNQIDADFSELTNQYKRRSDLIPNLVKVVKGVAEFERETLTGVVNARAKATSVQLSPDTSPEKLVEFQKAQGQLSQALGRLMMVSERYPNLKANQNFLDLQSQLEGTENRIAVARKRYIEAIKIFNNLVTVPPSSFTNSLVYKHDKMAQWTVPNVEEVKEVPKIDF